MLPSMRNWRRYYGLALISAATLMYELALTRVFAISEWYHFAFLSVGVALFGSAAGGAMLACSPPLRRTALARHSAPVFPCAIIVSYWAVNHIPFDSYQIAWDRWQLLYLGASYACLSAPFVASGALITHCLSSLSEKTHALYASNLVGAAVGASSLLGLLPLLGVEGAAFVAGLAAAAGGILLVNEVPPARFARWACWAALAACWALAVTRPAWLSLRLSPYKSLSYALARSDARLSFRGWSLNARIDVVESAQIHSAPGLSLNYRGELPPQHGLTLDGENLSPITRRQASQDRAYLAYLPSSLPYMLRPDARALIIQPRGGTDVAVALEHGASLVTVIEDDPLVTMLVGERYSDWTGGLYRDRRVSIRVQNPRSALQGMGQRYDIVQISLAESFHPLVSGAYSLAENHLLTVEGLASALQRLDHRGILVVTRWLQEQPSECLRAAATLVTALEVNGVRDPGAHLIAVRSWSTMLLLASLEPLDAQDVALVRAQAERLAYDLVHVPGISADEVNRFNRLPQPVYYDAYQRLLQSSDRRAFFRSWPYDVSPATDDRPFFGNTFRWAQWASIWQQLGKSWQPFGGSGFLIVVAGLVLSVLVGTGLVLLPGLLHDRPAVDARQLGPLAACFVGLGLGYMLVEMPLMQQFVLYLGQPTISFAVVLAALLVCSGVGSMLAPRIGPRRATLGLCTLILIYPVLLRFVFGQTQSWPTLARAGLTCLCLAPLGTLMGVPFAACLRRAEEVAPGAIPWAWATNGSASVVGTVLATLIALSAGYRVVWWMAAASYLIAAVAIGQIRRPVIRR